MDIRVLRYFLTICQEKNITKAAKKLHIAQPSLSKQIKELEEELGVTLFHRGYRKIELTEDGYFLRDRAQEIVNLTDNTTDLLSKNKIVSGQLTISAGQTQAIERLMKIVANIQETYPDIKIKLIDENADSAEAQINKGTADFALIMGDRPVSDFENLILPERNKYYAVFNKNLPLANKDKIQPQDLVSYPLLLSDQSFVQDKFKNWWGNLSSKVKIIGNSNLAYNISFLTRNSNFVQITYDNLIDLNSNSNLVIRPLSPEISDPNILIWKKNVHQSNLASLFLNEIKKSIKNDKI